MITGARSIRPALVCLSCLAFAPAQAQLTNCASLNANPGDYKVVLDDFAFASSAAQQNAELAALRERLEFNFNGQLDFLQASARQLDRSLNVPMRLVFCRGRQPSLDGSEFTDLLAERLSDERVVVEMWGRLDLRTNEDGTPAPVARIGYVIPPVQHYADEHEAPPLHLLAYPKSADARFLEELDNLPELSAFALVGLGTKAAKANLYDLAVWAFTRAQAGIFDAQVAGPNPRLELLLEYVKRSACQTRQKARRDATYQGPLMLLPEEQCERAS